eukprot:1110322-Pleurochrysis_carterae.AAC.1
MRKRGIQSLGSGARALRKYACDAAAIYWGTVHLSDGFAHERHARQEFVVKCRARAKVEIILYGS